MKSYIFIAVMLLFPQVADAASSSQTDYAIRLFSKICIANMGKDADSLAAWAKEHKLQRPDKQIENKILGAGQGTVWIASNHIGGFLLVFTNPYQCSVWAHKADVEQMKRDFSDIIERVDHPIINVEKIVDRSLEAHVGNYDQIGYFITHADKTNGFTAILGTNPRDPEIQARLTLSPAEKSKIEE